MLGVETAESKKGSIPGVFQTFAHEIIVWRIDFGSSMKFVALDVRKKIKDFTFQELLLQKISWPHDKEKYLFSSGVLFG